MDLNKYVHDLEKDPAMGFFNRKAGIAIYLFHLSRHTKDQDAEESAFNLMEEVANHIDLKSGAGFANGLSGIGAGISYIIRNEFMEGDEDEILTELDYYLFRYLYNTMHTDLSLNTGVIGAGHYFLNRIKSKTAISHSVHIMQVKMWLLMVLDLSATQFNLPGYTFMEPKKLSNREIIDIEYFLLCLVESGICNELSCRIMRNLKIAHPSPAYNPLDRLKIAELNGDDLPSALKALSEDKSYQNRLPQKLANLSLTNPSLPAWWRLF